MLFTKKSSNIEATKTKYFDNHKQKASRQINKKSKTIQKMGCFSQRDSFTTSIINPRMK